LSSHIFLQSHAPFIFPFFVTSTWWGGKPFGRRSTISISRVLFEDRCYALITACEGERSSSTPTPYIYGMPPFVAMLATWCLANPCALVSHTPFPPPLVGCINPPQCKFPCPAQFLATLLLMHIPWQQFSQCPCQPNCWLMCPQCIECGIDCAPHSIPPQVGFQGCPSHPGPKPPCV
jgi:hypothetical protein